MRVGLSGSSGLIGSALIEALSQRGDEVVRFVRATSRANAAAGTVRWDPVKGDIDTADLSGAGSLDAVINLSGAGIGDRRWSTAVKAEILASRRQCTSLLVETFSRTSHPPASFISASAVGYYGSRNDEVLSETSGRGAGFLADVSVAWEDAAAPFGAFGRLVVLRTGIVMSRSGGALARQLPLFRIGLGGVLGDGSQWVSPISLVDEVRAIMHILDHPIVGPVNLTNPQPSTNRTLTSTLAHALHRPGMFRAPASALRLALGREFADELILSSQRAVPQVLSESGFHFTHPDLGSIVNYVVTGS